MFSLLNVTFGSETKPKENIVELVHEIRDVDVEAHKVHDIIEYLEEEQHTLEEKHEKMSHRQLLDTLASLQRRIDQLEKKEHDIIVSKEEYQQKLNRTVKQLGCGGIAGAIARTTVCPLDRVKILLQTQHLTQNGGNKYGSIFSTLQTIVKEEGVSRLWRGNMTNMFRIVPYAATQFTSYDFFKTQFLQLRQDEHGADAKLRTHERLMSGALAATMATTVTHPLDVVRLRLAVQPELKGTADAFRSVVMENGARTLFKGYIPTVVSLAPFIAINFTLFDTLKGIVYPDINTEKSHFVVLGLGASAGIMAQTICYPLDTVRRRMQLKGNAYSGTVNAFQTIFKTEGAAGFYKGILPNAMKVVPNNAIRFLAYEFFKKKLNVTDKN